MNDTIWKFPVALAQLDDEIVISIPAPAEVLSVGEQFGQFVLWARVNPEAKQVHRVLCVRGTGHPFKGNEGLFIGTVQLSNGLVFHVFYALDKAYRQDVKETV